MHSLPQTYTVTMNGKCPAVILGAPVMRTLGAEVGDTVLVSEMDGELKIEVLSE